MAAKQEIDKEALFRKIMPSATVSPAASATVAEAPPEPATTILPAPSAATMAATTSSKVMTALL